MLSHRIDPEVVTEEMKRLATLPEDQEDLKRVRTQGYHLIDVTDYGVVAFPNDLTTEYAFINRYDEDGELMYKEAINECTPTSFVPTYDGRCRYVELEKHDGTRIPYWIKGQGKFKIRLDYTYRGDDNSIETGTLPRENYTEGHIIVVHNGFTSAVIVRNCSRHPVMGNPVPRRFRRHLNDGIFSGVIELGDIQYGTTDKTNESETEVESNE